MSISLIDIIIPNRNKASFLARTIASLRSQTEADWRAIVIDGDSNDGSLAILQAAALEDSRFVILTARPASLTGLSLYRSWNQGLLHVRAPYFAVLTSDDMWDPTWLRSALDALEANSQAIAAVSRAISIDAVDSVCGPTVSCKQLENSFALEGSGRRLLDSRSCAIRALLFGPIFSTIHSMVLRSSILEEGVIFAEDLGFAADIEYYLHACLRGDIVYDMEHRALFRTYEGQESSMGKGPAISHLWRKEIQRNRKLVARQLGIPLEELIQVTDEILERHLFVMTKPNRALFEKSKILAFFRMLRACCRSPRLGLEYIRVRASRERFLLEPAAALANQLSVKYGFRGA